MNALYEEFPTTVCIGGTNYNIITDFREWFRLIALLKDSEIKYQNKIYLFRSWIDTEDELDPLEMINELSKFMRADELYHSAPSTGSGKQNLKPLISYEIDANCIYSSFYDGYGMRLSELDYMHWWEFKLLLDGLPDTTEIKQRIKYRSVNVAEIKDKEEKKRISAIQKRIALPMSELTDSDIANAFM